jgi:hypothetical protein
LAATVRTSAICFRDRTTSPEPADQFAAIAAPDRDVVIVADKPAEDGRGGGGSIFVVAVQAAFALRRRSPLGYRTDWLNRRLAIVQEFEIFLWLGWS